LKIGHSRVLYEQYKPFFTTMVTDMFVRKSILNGIGSGHARMAYFSPIRNNHLLPLLYKGNIYYQPKSIDVFNICKKLVGKK